MDVVGGGEWIWVGGGGWVYIGVESGCGGRWRMDLGGRWRVGVYRGREWMWWEVENGFGWKVEGGCI